MSEVVLGHQPALAPQAAQPQAQTGITQAISYIASYVFNYIRFSLQCGVDLEARISEASLEGNLGKVAALATLIKSKNLDISAQNDGYNDFPTPLHIAVYLGKTDLAQILLDRGHDVNAVNGWGNTPLQYASSLKDGEQRSRMVRFLVDHGANVNVVDAQGNSPLSLAYKAGDDDLVIYLLQHGSTASAELVFHAYNRGKIDLIKRMIEEGLVNIDNMKDQKGTPFIMETYHRNNPEFTIWLVEHNANFRVVDRDGLSLIHLAVGDIPFFEGLIEHGLDINEKFVNGNTLAHWAASGNEPAFLRFLIQRGARVDEPNTIGITPFLSAIQRCSLECAQILKAQDVVLNRVDALGQTAAHFAAEKPGGAELLKLLPRELFDVQDRSGDTPLHLAAEFEQAANVAYLLTQKVRMNVGNLRGQTPMLLAKSKPAIRGLLEQAGARADIRDFSGHTAETRSQRVFAWVGNFLSSAAKDFQETLATVAQEDDFQQLASE